MTAAPPLAQRLNVVEHRSCREIRTDLPVVALHGIGGSAGSCAPLAERLAASGFSTWCVDAPGYGNSADPSPGDDVVSTVVDLLTSRWPGRAVILVGTSWGGVIATAVALRNPECVAALVLADSTRGSGTTPDKARAMRARIDDLRDRGAEAVAADRADRLLAPTADAAVAETVRRSMAAVREPGFAAAAEFMATTDHGAVLNRIDRPTMVLVGEHDVITGVDESRLLAENIPGAEFAVIPDAGHVAIQEQPDRIADLIIEFIGRLS
ncbi:alpha/beta fold hydrolase [Gordonia sp. OPL2]|uniref:alpha/beta fold hydrolase n=1 Tax=Gordonia sp. OPL2 TaxID=2486274 RepID=UPI0016553502|nr:alpha/beta hydrolase [Gordonia sp. OPL2]ROZ98098.1 alpha/beta hydrolase [Gordonia sp. OPL2]